MEEKSKKCIKEVLMTVPPNYPVNTIYLNGVPVKVWAFSNMDCEKCVAYFINEEGQVLIFDIEKIDGISFGELEDDDFDDDDC
ncbi:hypothetical protein [Metabacillus litoralis]|uniref:hypothetical protein n=1 Tax=Metabacillus litoralis TaxID=152268 RepID=UPI000EF624F2|nr:hypothetical protein [Metabacillus litoralis]MCM3159983.1 hypothetical protein [Metabacillus litoralis]